MTEDPNKRCGPGCPYDPFGFPEPSMSKKDKMYYPVLPNEPDACSVPPNKWMEMSTPESIENLTVDVNGKRKLCNQSCTQQITACGLNSNGVGNGVMDSVSLAGIGSGKGKFSLPMFDYIYTGDAQKESFKHEFNPLQKGGTTGTFCCKDGQVIGPGPFNASNLYTVSQCRKNGGHPTMDAVSCMLDKK